MDRMRGSQAIGLRRGGAHFTAAVWTAGAPASTGNFELAMLERLAKHRGRSSSGRLARE
jgi:hypothetical protein